MHLGKFRRLDGVGTPTFRHCIRVAALAMVWSAWSPVHAAAPDDTPEGFVRAIYARYAAHGPGVATTRPGGSSFYAPALLDAFAKAEASVPAGDIGPVDYDPLCACQDFDDVKLKTVDVAPSGAGRASAQVAFTDAGTNRRLALSLVRTPVGWRVDDVGAPGRKTLAAVLRAAIGPKRR